MNDIRRDIQQLTTKVDNIEAELLNTDLKVNSHPIIFIALMIGLFVTMNFMGIAAHNIVLALHPNKQLQYWEYTLLAIGLLLLLLWAVNKNGITIRQL